MTMRATLTLLSDSVGGSGGSLYAATTWNTPYLQVADLFDSHVLNASQNGMTVYQHKDSDIFLAADYVGGTARSAILSPANSVRQAIDELVYAWGEITGNAPSTFHTAGAPTQSMAAMATTLAAATNVGSVANAGKLAKYASDGGMAFAGALTAVNFSTSGTLQVGTNASVAGTLAVTGAVTFTAALFGGVFSDYRVSPSATGDAVTVAAGGSYVDASLQRVPGSAAQLAIPLANSVAASPPSVGNVQYVGIYLPQGSSTAQTVGGVVGVLGSTATRPAFPANSEAIAMVIRRAGGVVVAAADIEELRNFVSGGGGGTGGGAPATIPYLTNGTNVSLPAAVDVTSFSTAAAIQLNVVQGMTDILNPFVQPDITGPGRLYISGLTVNVAAFAGSPATIIKGQYRAKATTTVTSPAATGANGVRYIVADLGAGTGNAWTLVLQTSLNVAANQVYLGQIWADTTNGLLWLESLNTAILQNIDGAQVGLHYRHANANTNAAGTLTATTFTAIPQYNAIGFVVGASCVGTIYNTVDIVNNSGTGTFQVGAQLTCVEGGGPSGIYAVYQGFNILATDRRTATMMARVSLQPGSYVLGQAYLITGTVSLSCATTTEAYIDIHGQGA